MKKKLRLLILEDQPLDAELEIVALEESGFECSWNRVQTQEDFITYLENQDYDLIIADYSLPAFDGLTALNIFKQHDLDVPFVLVSGNLGEEVAIESLKAGATDYVLKDRLSRLGPVVERALQEKEEQKQRRNAEKAQKESEENYRSLFENIADAVYITDKETMRFLDCNKAAVDRLGYSREEYLTMVPIDLHPPGDLEIIKSEIKNNSTFMENISHISKDGVEIPVEINASQITYKGREAWVSIVRDVSERKAAEKERRQLEAQLQQAQKMEAVGTLAGGIAHDFNNLLQGMLGFSQILLLDMKDDDPKHKEIGAIEKAAQRASELVQQLLTFSRKVESHLRPLNINQTIKEVEKFLKRTIPKMINITLRLEENPEIVNADPVQIEQLLMNLAVNAKDSMPDGGQLIIETKNVFLDQDFCRLNLGAKPGKHLFIAVSDTGFGMSSETLEHIFEPFYTTKDVGKGTGLGLAMVYGIVKNHRGHIACTSKINQGTTFEIYLPVMEKITGDPVFDSDHAKPRGGTETILLVDDEKMLLEIGEKILTRYGYRVKTAVDGEEALDIFKQQHQDISLIILDLIMPGMGGNKCFKELIKLDAQAKIVIASGYKLDDEIKAQIGEKAKGVISKPYNVNQMLNVVREVLDDQV